MAGEEPRVHGNEADARLLEPHDGQEPELASVTELLCHHEHSATLVACLSVTAVNWMANSMLATFFPQEAAREGISLSTIGLVFAASPLANFFSAPLAGWLNGDSLCGRKYVLFSGLVLFAATNFTMGYCVQIGDWLSGEVEVSRTTMITAAFLFCRVLQGISQGFCETSSFAVLTDQFPDDLVTVVGLNEAVIGIMYIVGPPAGAFLYVAQGFAFPFVVLTAITILLLLVFLLVPLGIVWSDQEEAADEAGCSNKEEEDAGEEFQIGDLWHQKVIAPVVCVFFVGMANGFAEPLLSVHLQTTLHISIEVSKTQRPRS